AYAYSAVESDTNPHAHSKSDGDVHSDNYADPDSDLHSNSHAYTNALSYIESDTNVHANSYSDANPDPPPEASSDVIRYTLSVIGKSKDLRTYRSAAGFLFPITVNR